MKANDPSSQNFEEIPIVSAPLVETPGMAGGNGFSLHDILYVLFRHKGKIVTLGVIGLAAAASVYLLRTPLFESQAKLLVPYVLDTNVLGETKSQVTSSSGAAGRSVLNVEVDLITSWDLAESVVGEVGVDTILSGSGKATTVSEAAKVLLERMQVTVPPDSTVIHVSYLHPDPVQVRNILGKLVEAYRVKHKETHRSIRSFDYVDKKATEAKTALESARNELYALKKGQNIVSFQNRETSLSRQQAAIEEELFVTEAKRAEQAVRVRSAEALTPGSKGIAKPREEIRMVAPGNREIEDYRALIELLDSLKKRRNEQMLTYTDSNGSVRIVQERIEEAESKRQTLLKKFPGLAATVVKTANGEPVLPVDAHTEREALDSIEARIRFLEGERKKVEEELSVILVAGSRVAQLERDIQAHEANYRYYDTALERAKVDQVLKPSELENITVIQQPSVASRTTAGSVKKLVLGLSFGGFAVGIALAFLIELFLDRSVKRPQEFESQLQLPLMLSIPFLESSRRPQLQLNGSGGGFQENDHDRIKGSAGPSKKSSGLLALPTPWETAHFIRPFADAIRDRIGYHFHINGITHKPKLIGLTGFSGGAGTSTLAAALAASFAEMTDGKILYVNLNGGVPALDSDQAEGVPFGQDVANLESGNDAFGLIEHQDNLFVATITPGKSRKGIPDSIGKRSTPSFVPKQLWELMPRLRASDFEYVIFDMPALGPTSPTLAIAGFMDKVLLVVDAGKTDRDIVRRSYHELTAKANADVSTILNKTRESLPAWLQG